MKASPSRKIVAASKVTLRRAKYEDCQRVWMLRNDPETRQASFDSAKIPWKTHERWFSESLLRDDREIFMVAVRGRRAVGRRREGVARLDIADREAAVSIYLAAEWRGRRVGPSALDQLAVKAFRELGLDRLFASVKADNTRSLAAFARAGFTEVDRQGGVVTVERRR